VFQGDDELNFTPEEAAAVARAEGRTPRRGSQTTVQNPQPHHGGGGGVLLGIVLVVALVVGLIEYLKVLPNADAGAVANQHVRALAQQSSPQIDRKPNASQPENPPSPLRETSGAPEPVTVQSVQNLLPPGWDRTAFMRDNLLLANPRQDARVIGPIPAGTELLIRITPAGGSCSNDPPPQGLDGYVWHAAVLASGTGWGYVCVAFPESFDANIRKELPPGWIRRAYWGDGPALLQYPNGQILPGTQMLMRAKGSSPDDFFVMSADGLAWGFGQFQIETQSAEELQAVVQENLMGRSAALPPGWERVVLDAETTLYQGPRRTSAVVGTLPPGTVVFLKHLWESWYGTVTESGDASGSIYITTALHEPTRMTFGDWAYERMPSGNFALIRRLPGDLVLYILAHGNGWGKASPAVL